MRERKYRVSLAAPLGARDGTMVLHEADGKVDGWLNVMHAENYFSGTLSEDGQLALSGMIRTLISTLHYTAAGTVSGKRILLNLKTDSGAQYPVSGEEYSIDDKAL